MSRRPIHAGEQARADYRVPWCESRRRPGSPRPRTMPARHDRVADQRDPAHVARRERHRSLPDHDRAVETRVVGSRSRHRRFQTTSRGRDDHRTTSTSARRRKAARRSCPWSTPRLARNAAASSAARWSTISTARPTTFVVGVSVVRASEPSAYAAISDRSHRISYNAEPGERGVARRAGVRVEDRAITPRDRPRGRAPGARRSVVSSRRAPIRGPPNRVDGVRLAVGHDRGARRVLRESRRIRRAHRRAPAVPAVADRYAAGPRTGRVRPPSPESHARSTRAGAGSRSRRAPPVRDRSDTECSSTRRRSRRAGDHRPRTRRSLLSPSTRGYNATAMSPSRANAVHPWSGSARRRNRTLRRAELRRFERAAQRRVVARPTSSMVTNRCRARAVPRVPVVAPKPTGRYCTSASATFQCSPTQRRRSSSRDHGRAGQHSGLALDGSPPAARRDLAMKPEGQSVCQLRESVNIQPLVGRKLLSYRVRTARPGRPRRAACAGHRPSGR